MSKTIKILFPLAAAVSFAGAIFSFVWCLIHLNAIKVITYDDVEGFIGPQAVSVGTPVIAIGLATFATLAGAVFTILALRKGASKTPIVFGVLSLLLWAASCFVTSLLLSVDASTMLLFGALPAAVFTALALLRYATAHTAEKPAPEMKY
jgi:hypothetical protein